METPDEVKHALERLSLWDRTAVESWLHELNERQAGSCRVEEARAIDEIGEPMLMTLEQFLEFERKSPMRHEFVNGFVFAMTGGTLNHARITQNLWLAFHNHLKRGPCEAFASNAKVVIENDANEIVYYPDVLVDCRPATRGDDHVRDPRLVVEVLSPSTRHIDRREKLQNYRLIQSLEEYVLVAQAEHRLVIHRRAGRWRPEVCASPDSTAEFRSIELSVPLSEIYDGVGTVSGSAPDE